MRRETRQKGGRWRRWWQVDCQNYVQSTLNTSVYSNRKGPDLAFWLRGPEVKLWCRAECSRLTARQTQVPPITSLIAALVCSYYWNWASSEISVAPVILLPRQVRMWKSNSFAGDGETTCSRAGRAVEILGMKIRSWDIFWFARRARQTTFRNHWSK